MRFRIHEAQGKRVLAVCDRDLLGRVIKEDGVVLDLDQYRDFYDGDDFKGIEEFDFDSANIVGPKSVSYFIEKGLAEESNVKYIGSIPYLHIYRIKI